eukprot:TRINITY_DN22366_c1_g1_i1.p1 TRINITY_DN22366_c1_g1~~TRINITY_DN22366_c1_g1_i1.p1  ORF type:complete len:215 (+),score=26.81 TRINITY_DN22366_c1_g1_i1:60-704(+)
MGRSPSVSSNDSAEDAGRKRRKIEEKKPTTDDGKVHEELSIEATNELRAKLGLKPLHGTTEAVKEQKTVESPPEEEKEMKEGDFHEELSIEQTNALRAKLGLKPLYAEEQRTARNEIFNPDSVAESVQKATSDLKLDKRIGINKVRAQSSWDKAFLGKTQSGKAEGFETAYLDTGSGDIIEPDFEGGKWNVHLNIAATNVLRERVGLRPLHAPC